MELAHDRLIGPIRSSNARVRDRRRRRRSWLAATAVLLTAALAGGLIAVASVGFVGKVTTPSVKGMTSAFVAQRTLDRAHLQLGTVTEQVTSGVKARTIVGQSPLAGASVKKGTAVNVLAAVSPNVAAIPNVVGLTLEGASTRLQSLD